VDAEGDGEEGETVSETGRTKMGLKLGIISVKSVITLKTTAPGSVPKG